MSCYSIHIDVVGIKCKRVICSLHKLLQLAGGVCNVNNCGSNRVIDYKTSGCCITIFGTCTNGHPFHWESSDLLYSEDRRKVYLYNLHFAATLVLSGNHYKKIEMLARFYGLQILCSSSFYAYQRHYICPGVNRFYEHKQVYSWLVLLITHNIKYSFLRWIYWPSIRTKT